MAYDVLAESIALIETGRAEPVLRLSRRRRFAPMAVDVAGDVAATLFARRGVGRIWKEIHVLVLRDGEWTWLGGSSGDSDPELMADRPAVLREYFVIGEEAVQGVDPRAVGVIVSGGGVLDDCGGSGGFRRRERWISYAELRVNAQVTSVRVGGRELVVPWHGHVMVVWSEREPPRAVAVDEGGKSLAEVQLTATG